MDVDRGAPVPLYEQIKNLLVAELKHASEPSQQLILSDAALMRRFGVSRMTVRSAIADLVREGVVTRIPGRGTFLNVSPPLAVRRDGLERLVHEWSLEYQRQPARVLEFVFVRAPYDVARRLRLSGGEKALFIRRLHDEDGEPIALDEDYVAPWCALGLTGDDVSTTPIFEGIEKKSETRSTAVEQEIAAIAADGQIAELLHVAPGAPLLSRAVTYFTATKRPTYTGVGYYRSDRFTFQMRVTL